MRLEIRLFARLRDLHGQDRLAVEVPAGATVAELRRAIAREHPGLAEFLPSARVAASLRMVTDARVLNADEELALIPPVSGG